jgi:hypothetical protein
LAFGSAGLVSDRCLGSLGEELDRRETPDIVLGSNRLVVGLVCVHVGDDTVGLRSERSSDILVCGLHVLVVSTLHCSARKGYTPCSDHTRYVSLMLHRVDRVTYPRSSEGNENILFFIQNDIVKVTSSDLNSSRRGRGLDLGLRTRFLRNTTYQLICF